MSWQHPQHGDGDLPRVYGVYDAAESAHIYEAYADPAAAHGWCEQPLSGPAQGEAPAVAAGMPAAPVMSGAPYAEMPHPDAPYEGEPYQSEPYPDLPHQAPAYLDAPVEAPADDFISTSPLPVLVPPDEGRAVFVDGSGRRRKLMRRVAVGLGAACVVFLGVVVAGLFGSGPAGSPLPWGPHKGDTKAPRAEHSPSSSTSEREATPRKSPDPAVPAGTPSASPRASVDKDTGKQSTAPSASTAPSTTAPTTSAPARGNGGDNPGRGHGSTGTTKGPK
ncbi:hypothetical protein ACFVY1_24670 [Streptomyces sp. NPDC058293]|uniref:hypothetical protein n=1 Tax=Streptomyces sp. NPDC058293 TaxID=3346429 RepID=UPI0036E9EA1B